MSHTSIKCPVKYCTYEANSSANMLDHLIVYHSKVMIAEALATKLLEEKEK